MDGICSICGARDHLEEYRFSADLPAVKLCTSCEDVEYTVYVRLFEQGLAD